jgi:ribose-phosphate pyrophosphokinase
MQDTGLQPPEVPRAAASVPGRLVLASCRSGSGLARRVVEQLRQQIPTEPSHHELVYLENVDDRFSDSETRVRLGESVEEADLFLFQGLHNPASGRSIDENVMAFLIAARAAREWGASRITAVLPYLAYARQDKPTPSHREPATARLISDLTRIAGVDQVVTWHPHKAHLQALFSPIAVHTLDPWPLFVEIFRAYAGRPDVILVSPDAGAAKFVTKVGRQLGLHSAIASKYRPQPEEAAIQELIGDFSCKQTAIILDDMVSSGGTVYALARELAGKGIQEIRLGVSHNLCLAAARQRLQELHSQANLVEFVATNSISQTGAFLNLSFFRVVDLSGIFAQVILQMHANQPLRWGTRLGETVEVAAGR